MDNNLKLKKKKLMEVESIILIDNFKREIIVFSNRNASIKKLYKILGEPNKINYIKNEIESCEWNIPFYDRKKIKKILSINLYFLNK